MIVAFTRVITDSVSVQFQEHISLFIHYSGRDSGRALSRQDRVGQKIESIPGTGVPNHETWREQIVDQIIMVGTDLAFLELNHRHLINTLISRFTASFARDAETAEISIFSIVLERRAMEKYSAPTLCAGTAKVPF